MSRSTVKKRDIHDLLGRHLFMKTMEDYYFIFTIPLRDFFPAVDKTLGINSTQVILPLVINYAKINMDGYSDDYNALDVISSIFSTAGTLPREARMIAKFFIYDIFYLADKKRKEKHA
ncbi:MAG TPA: hypothetical protein DEO87_02360 [Lachnospiraceae bacterium]|nr:hypothetical protein [Lachnospiraceae bacterium]